MTSQAERGKYTCTALETGRHGLTTLEIVGCLVAVVGGAWIGALYLGVNMEHVAHSALSRTQLLDMVPPEWQPQGPDAVSPEQLAMRQQKELGALQSEILALRSGGATASNSAPNSDATAGKRASTRAYWLRLSEIAFGEDQMQRDAEATLNETNTAKVFAIKSRVSRLAAMDIEAIKSDGVDEAVVKYGQDLAVWYGRANELYERAAQIWESSSGQHAREQLTQAWRRDDLQHRQEARLLRERAAALRATVSRRLGEELPEFASPASFAAKGEGSK